MKIVIAPDKFKGSLAADRVAAAIAAGLRAELPTAELVTIPVAGLEPPWLTLPVSLAPSD